MMIIGCDLHTRYRKLRWWTRRKPGISMISKSQEETRDGVHYNYQ